MTYKLQVLVSEEMKERIEFYAKKSGVSMSALCNVFIGQGILGYDKAYELADKMFDKLEKQMEASTDKIAMPKR